MKSPALSSVLFLAGVLSLPAQEFSYLPLVEKGTRHLFLTVELVDNQTGIVRVNGVDTRSPSVPFTWNWGDGSLNTGWFPQQHTYTNKGKNYLLKVTSSGETAEAYLLLIEPSYTPVSLPANTAIIVAERTQQLPARWYNQVDVVPFSPEDFGIISRRCIEYVSSAMADIQHQYTNGQLWYCEDQGFNQVIFKTDFAGGYSCWFTDPPSFAVSGTAFKGTIGWNTLAHEMGHNFTLDFPGTYHIGGRIDGNANAIFSETMAQIFSLSCGSDLINRKGDYGISADLATSLQLEFENAFMLVKDNHQKYIDNGKHFCCWNDSQTTGDETFTTFMTIAYEFLVRGENTDQSLGYHVTRLMDFFSHFNQNWDINFDRNNPSDKGKVFRATMMVAGISFALRQDLRNDFIDLGFPVDDGIYDDLMNQASVGMPEDPDENDLCIWPNPVSSRLMMSGFTPESGGIRITLLDGLGQPVISLIPEINKGTISLDFSKLPAGIYLVIVFSDTGLWTRRVVHL